MWNLKTMLIGLAVLTAGCGAAGSTPQSPTPDTGGPSADANQAQRGKTRVEIDNQNFSDMNVYLIGQGTRLLLGSATGLSKTTLLIPQGNLGGEWRVRLQADPIGGSAPIRTPTLLVPPGQSVYWTIGANPADSFASAG